MTPQEKTVKVWIQESEYYPFCIPQTSQPYAGSGDPVSVSPMTLRRWQRVMKQFEQVQREMKEAS